MCEQKPKRCGASAAEIKAALKNDAGAGISPSETRMTQTKKQGRKTAFRAEVAVVKQPRTKPKRQKRKWMRLFQQIRCRSALVPKRPSAVSR